MKGGLRIPSFSVLLIFAVLTVIGAAMLPSLNLQYLPRDKQQTMSVTFYWQDASARVIESEVTSRIEGYIASIKGISSISSMSRKEEGSINITLKKKEDVDAIRFEISSALRSLYDQLPDGVSYPELSVSTGGANVDPILTYTVNADLPTNQIEQYINDHILKDLSIIEGVSSVRLSGATPNYMEIAFNPEKMKAAGVSTSELYSAVSSYLQGTSVVGSAPAYNPDEEPDIILRNAPVELSSVPVANKEGRIIRLSDVASITLKERQPDSYYRINGLNTINITVYPEESINTVQVCHTVEETMSRLEAGFPESFSALKAYDVSTEISEEVGKLIRRTLLCVVILLAFILATTFSLRYTFLIGLTLLVNLIVACIFYVLLDIDIHIYSLAGISISLSIIIDNSIIMVSHYSYYRDRKVFLAILAALLTTIGSLAVIFFLPEEQKRILADFSTVIIINLSVSMVTALFFVPALLDYLPVKSESIAFSIRRRRKIVRFSQSYARFIFYVKKFNWAVILFFLLAFGGSFMLFRKSLDGFASMFRQPERPVLYISAGMPEGCSVQQLNEIIVYMENFLAGFDEIKLFRTSITSYDRGSISVEFHDDVNRTSFPAVLKQQVIRKAIDYGGANWSVYGINDQNFSNYIGGATYRNGNIILSGYNYDILYGFCEDLVDHLSANPRVTDLSIEGPESYYYSSSEGSREYLITYDYDNLSLYGISPVSAFSALSERLFSQYVGSTPGDYGTRMDVRLISDDTENFDVWHLANEYIRIDSTDIRFAEIGSIDSRNSGNNIFRQDQEYILCVRYNFIGSYKLEERLMESEIERLNSSVLPIGFKASSPQYDWMQKAKNQWILLVLIVVIIYMICAVLFESLLQPLAIISLIPVSFIGIFLAFRLTETTFDQGGFASMIMLAGIVVNAGIYIVNEYNRMPAHRRSFIRAYNHKIIPISLTILSTVLGLVPFLLDGKEEVFWFAFAIGTMGGMLFSYVALVIFLPMIMPGGNVTPPGCGGNGEPRRRRSRARKRGSGRLLSGRRRRKTDAPL